MAGKGRKAGFQMGAEHRSKIGNSRILSRLIRHAEGKEEMKPTEVTAALGLLDRVMPKLKQTELTGGIEATIVRRTIYEAKPGEADSE